MSVTLHNTLQQKLASWDGKSADELAEIYSSHADEAQFSDVLTSLVSDASSQKGASWLLKKWLESGNQISDKNIMQVYSSLQLLEDWESKLHVLQSIPYMPIAEGAKRNLESFLRQTLTDSNKFVRAWTYNGFYELAREYPEYREEVEQFLAMALRDESASVKARIRNIMKTGFEN